MSTTPAWRGITRSQFDALHKALADRDVWDHIGVTLIATLYLTPGVNVIAALKSEGIVDSSAHRIVAACEEVLGARPADPHATVRRALADAVHYLEHPDKVIPANRVRQLRVIAGVRPVDADTPFTRGMEGSARAAAKWTDEEVKAVDKAIETVAAASGYANAGDAWFTADDVWAELGPEFLVTKGLAGRLTAAANRGLIRSTGNTTISGRDGEHGHGQRLTVWQPTEHGAA